MVVTAALVALIDCSDESSHAPLSNLSADTSALQTADVTLTIDSDGSWWSDTGSLLETSDTLLAAPSGGGTEATGFYVRARSMPLGCSAPLVRLGRLRPRRH
jgi:hypothetical protein